MFTMLFRIALSCSFVIFTVSATAFTISSDACSFICFVVVFAASFTACIASVPVFLLVCIADCITSLSFSVFAVPASFCIASSAAFDAYSSVFISVVVGITMLFVVALSTSFAAVFMNSIIFVGVIVVVFFPSPCVAFVTLFFSFVTDRSTFGSATCSTLLSSVFPTFSTDAPNFARLASKLCVTFAFSFAVLAACIDLFSSVVFSSTIDFSDSDSFCTLILLDMLEYPLVSMFNFTGVTVTFVGVHDIYLVTSTIYLTFLLSSSIAALLCLDTSSFAAVVFSFISFSFLLSVIR